MSVLAKFFSFVLILASGTSQADIYKYVDQNGHVHYTDKAKHKGFKLLIRSSPTAIIPGDAARFDRLIQQVSEKHQIDAALVHAVIRAESAYDPQAVSRKGAVGLMQLMPATASRFGVSDRKNPSENINGGVQYLKLLLQRFNSNLELAIAAYNAGENAIERYGNRVPPYPETQAYVKKVLAFYNK